VKRKMQKEKSDTTLVIGDAHVDPKQVRAKRGLDRFKWAHEYILDTRPCRVVIIGDWYTLDSVSSHNNGKFLTKEGQRYLHDLYSGDEALRILDVPKNTELVFVEGNHEERARRFIEQVPELEGEITLPEDHVRALYPDVKWIPYKEFYTHKGVSFTHVPFNEGGKPVGGKTATARALELCDTSVVFGHTHKLDIACVHRHGGSHLVQAVNVGCFFEHVDDYARGTVTSYWRGLVTLDHYDYGRVDMETTALGKLRRKYG